MVSGPVNTQRKTYINVPMVDLGQYKYMVGIEDCQLTYNAGTNVNTRAIGVIVLETDGLVGDCYKPSGVTNNVATFYMKRVATEDDKDVVLSVIGGIAAYSSPYTAAIQPSTANCLGNPLYHTNLNFAFDWKATVSPDDKQMDQFVQFTLLFYPYPYKTHHNE